MDVGREDTNYMPLLLGHFSILDPPLDLCHTIWIQRSLVAGTKMDSTRDLEQGQSRLKKGMVVAKVDIYAFDITRCHHGDVQME